MFRQHIVAVFLVDLRLALFVVSRYLGNAQRNVVQVLLEQRLQFALHVPFVQMEHLFAGRYNKTCAEINENADDVFDFFLEANDVVFDVDNGQNGFSVCRFVCFKIFFEEYSCLEHCVYLWGDITVLSGLVTVSKCERNHCSVDLMPSNA